MRQAYFCLRNGHFYKAVFTDDLPYDKAVKKIITPSYMEGFTQLKLAYTNIGSAYAYNVNDVCEIFGGDWGDRS